MSLLGQPHPSPPDQLALPLIYHVLAFITLRCDRLPSSAIRLGGHGLCPFYLWVINLKHSTPDMRDVQYVF